MYQGQGRTFEDGSQEQHMNRGHEQGDVGKYYRLLGVKEGAPLESVRRGYHRMSKDHQCV